MSWLSYKPIGFTMLSCRTRHVHINYWQTDEDGDRKLTEVRRDSTQKWHEKISKMKNQLQKPEDPSRETGRTVSIDDYHVTAAIAQRQRLITLMYRNCFISWANSVAGHKLSVRLCVNHQSGTKFTFLRTTTHNFTQQIC